MSNVFQQQIRVVDRSALRSNVSTIEATFFDADGNEIPVGSKAANVAPVTTADGSDATTTQALANANKVAINAIIDALIDAGVMEAS